MHQASTPTERLAALGIALPSPWTTADAAARGATERKASSPLSLGPGVEVYAEFVRVAERRVLVSGHLPLDPQGLVAGPFGRVGDAVDVADARICAQRCMLGIFSSLMRALGSLDRIACWLHVYGMVNAASDFHDFPDVINSASKLVYDVFGTRAGQHARIAIGVGGLPFNAPVGIAAELLLKPEATQAG